MFTDVIPWYLPRLLTSPFRVEGICTGTSVLLCANLLTVHSIACSNWYVCGNHADKTHKFHADRTTEAEAGGKP